MGSQLEFRILGPLEVAHEDGILDVGPFKQRALLALLLINANEVVSTDRILDELWGVDAAAKQNTLWVHVSNLRSALEPGRAPRAENSVLISRSPGYLLRTEPDRIDAHRFEMSLAEGRRLIEIDPISASRVLAAALAMWRGRALEDFTYEEFAQPEIRRLTDLRVDAVEERIEADLRAGYGPQLVGELEGLVREHPLRERLTGQIMLALYRADRQAEALRTYQRLRSRLGESLGIEPSPTIRRLEEQILIQDPALVPAAPVTNRYRLRPTVRGYELRDELGRGSHGVVFETFQPAVGREVAVKLIPPQLANDADFIRRFETEVRVVAALEHPHIVPLYDYWREPNGAYVVMRLMKGGSLRSARDRDVTTPRALAMVGQVSAALAAAHAQGVVHGNVKPSNILLDADGNAYLTDFGIASEGGGRRPHPRPDEPYASPEHLNELPLTPRSDVYSLGMVLKDALTGDPANMPPPLTDVADRATSPSPDDRYPDAETFLAELLGAAEQLPSPPPRSAPGDNPYRGLRSFDETDAATFFGRERLIERLLARLGSPGRKGRFLVLVGPSGSGKSSVINAGLLPALRRGAVHGSEQWFLARMVPGGHPFEALENALLRVAVDPPSTLLEQLEANERGLRRAASRILPEPDSQLLVVIDQFEELFTQVDNEATRRSFLRTLRSAVEEGPTPVRIVATLRADFYDRPLRYHDFGELLRGGTEVITPMSPEELERAIAGPTESVGAALEPGLAAAVVADVADEPSALPLMQYAMTELYERREGVMLTAGSYHQLGGVAGALGRRAEEIFDLLDEEARAAARQVFLRLVALGEGEEPTRARVLRSELQVVGTRPETVDRVLDVYGRHRLLIFDRDTVSRGPTVELAHEALMKEWPRYGEWVEQAQEDLRRRRRLTVAAAEWQRNKEDPSYLLTGSRLAETQAWTDSSDLALTELETRYVAESQRRSVEAEHSRRRRRRLIAAALTAVGALALSFLVFAMTQRSAVDRIAAIERINRTIDAAANALPDDPELSLLLAAAAADRTEGLGLEVFPENLGVLHQALRSHRLLFTIEEATSAVFSVDGTVVYAGHEGGRISMRDSTSGEEIDSIDTPVSPVVDEPGASLMPLGISEDGRWLSTGYALVDTQTLEQVEITWEGVRLSVHDVALSRDGSHVALAHLERGRDAEGSITLWDRERRTELWSRSVAGSGRVAFHPSGDLLAVSSNTTEAAMDTVHIFDVASGAEANSIPMEDPWGIGFRPSGDHLAIGDAGVIRYWDLGSETFSFRVDGGHGISIPSLDFGAGGQRLASSDMAGGVIIRDAGVGEPLFPLPDHRRIVTTVDLSSDGSRLATVTPAADDDPGTLRVFDTGIEGGRDLATIAAAGGFLATVDVDPSATSIAVGSHGEGVREVRAITGETRLALPDHAPFRQHVGVAGPIAFSPDGARLATGDADGYVYLWDAESGEQVAARHVRDLVPQMGETLGRASGLGEAVFIVSFSPDGEHLAMGGAGFVLLVDPDLDTARLLDQSDSTFTESLAFGADGRTLITTRSKGVQGTQDEVISGAIAWDVATGEEIATHETAERVMAVDYSETGDLAVVGADTHVTVVDADTLDPIHVLESGHGEVWDVAFAPDGSVLAASYDDGSIVIWDPGAGVLLYELAGHEAFAADLDWTDDGSRLVSVGIDDTIRIYSMEPTDLRGLARARATRELTTEECHQYLGPEGC